MFFNTTLKHNIDLRFVVVMSALLIAVIAGPVIAQTAAGRGRNNPYSPSPAARTASTADTSPADPMTPAVSIAQVSQPQTKIQYPVASDPKPEVLPDKKTPAENYRIGAGDVLYIELASATNASGYYTVRDDGTIDFPLVGEKVSVADLAAEEAARKLAAGIELFPNARVSVKVREFRSHKVIVSGMVERPGEQSLQREAMPLYVLRAEAIADSRATKAVIHRSETAVPEVIDLRQPGADSTLIYPGNRIEFASDAGAKPVTNASYFYISGDVASAGQKEFTPGLTLLQAIVASGGAKGNPKKATIRRKRDTGVLNVSEFNLRKIKDGKSADPSLAPGDMIEIGD